MSRVITIDVRRDDEEVTRIQGDQGIAVAANRPPDDARLEGIDPGVVSLRCDDEMGLALCLASILAAVSAVAPNAIVLAAELAKTMDGSNPQFRRELPKRTEE